MDSLRRGAVPLALGWLVACGEPTPQLLGQAALRAAVPVRADLDLAQREAVGALPQRLSETGLYTPGTTAIDPRNLAYAPQYPLWSDGATKRRWLRLPEGARIDASDPDHWRFPAGTRFWKEFSFGARVETRYFELTASGLRYAAYVWNAEGSDAVLVPERGLRGVAVGSERHDIPSRADCAACHEGRPGGVLGFNALQLSPERDPQALHGEPAPEGGLDLAQLAERELISDVPDALLHEPPRIHAATPEERAALGYLYGNCAQCHNAEGPLAELGLDFDQPATAAGAERVRASSFGRASRYRPPGAEASLRIAPGDPEHSSVAYRLRTASPAARMPPLGTRRIDAEAVALIERWIHGDP